MFEFDGGGDGSRGPWLVWSARGTQDGAINPKSFYIRETAGKTPTDAFDRGVVVDVHSLRTGWQQSGGTPGVAPKWLWGDSPARLPAKPADDYKKGFAMRVALGGGVTVLWEQAGVAAWQAFEALVPGIKAGATADKDKLPLVRMTGTELLKFPTGTTVRPILEIVKWVQRPDCLKDGAAAGIDTGADDQPKAPPAPPPLPPAAQELADDDIAF